MAEKMDKNASTGETQKDRDLPPEEKVKLLEGKLALCEAANNGLNSLMSSLLRENRDLRFSNVVKWGILIGLSALAAAATIKVCEYGSDIKRIFSPYGGKTFTSEQKEQLMQMGINPLHLQKMKDKYGEK